MLNIRYELTKEKKPKPDPDKLGFGKYYTDHMFVMDYTEGQGWHDARIVPFANLSLSPAAMVFHYAQEMFEGLKAYRAKDGRVLLFRPDKNIERMANTNDRLCIPQIPNADVLDALRAIVRTDSDWIPEKEERRSISARSSSLPKRSSAYILPRNTCSLLFFPRSAPTIKTASPPSKSLWSATTCARCVEVPAPPRSAATMPSR